MSSRALSIKWASLLFVLCVGPTQIFSVECSRYFERDEPQLKRAKHRYASILFSRPPPPIKRSDVQTQPTELEKAGRRAKNGEDLSKLSPGVYPFIIINPSGKPGGEVVYFTNRLPEEIALNAQKTGEMPDKFLGTHRSLVNTAAAELRKSPEQIEKLILSSGQIVQLPGGTNRIDDQSGTFPGGETNFNWGRYILRTKHKLKKQPGTLIYRVSKTGKTIGHQQDSDYAKLALEHIRDKELYSIRIDLLALQAKLSEVFPLQKETDKMGAIGMIDTDKLSDFMSSDRLTLFANLKQKERKKALTILKFQLLSFINVWQSEGSVDVSINGYVRKGREEAIKQLKVFVDSMNKIYLDKKENTSPS